MYQVQESERTVRALVTKAMENVCLRYDEHFFGLNAEKPTLMASPPARTGPHTPPIQRMIRSMQQQDWGPACCSPQYVKHR
jgi:hypothetical protein